jgi:hypothetical protein
MEIDHSLATVIQEKQYVPNTDRRKNDVIELNKLVSILESVGSIMELFLVLTGKIKS